MSVVWLDKDELFPTAIKAFSQVDVVLDIGCGIMPQHYICPLVHVCCEPFSQYVEVLQGKVKEEYDRTYVIINGGWADVVSLFPPKSVDTVFLVDVIEHLEKEEATELLKATEALVRKQVALFTPLGFMPQYHPDGKDAWGLNGADWQEHKSGWSPNDFDETWDIYAAKVFHTSDNMGKSFETPYGAMWAIKSFEVVEEKKSINLCKRNSIRKINRLAVEINGNGLLSLIAFSMKITLKIVKTRSYDFLYKMFFRNKKDR